MNGGMYGRQLTLDPDPIDAAWRKFHYGHPEVGEHLIRLARQWKAAGNGKVGLSLLWEVMRWERGLEGVKDDEGLKLNNNYRSRYSRHIMATCPDLDGIFDTRTLRSDVA